MVSEAVGCIPLTPVQAHEARRFMAAAQRSAARGSVHELRPCLGTMHTSSTGYQGQTSLWACECTHELSTGLEKK